MGTAGTTGAADKNQPIALSGCLQRGSGITDKFILTSVNGTEPNPNPSATPTPNATTANPNPSANPAPTGTAGGSDVVGREQHALATKSYRIDGDDDQLRDLVGKQVRLNGHITDRGDLGSADRPATTTGGKVDRDISQSDLARVKVDSIEKVSDSCGAPSNPQ